MSRETGWSAVCRRGFFTWALAAAATAPLGAQHTPYDSAAVTVAGTGPTTYVLITGLVGGVAGYHRLQASLVEHGSRVIIIDPYRLAVDSADVTFAALATIVDGVLAAYDVDSARVVGHAHGAGVALRLAANAPSRVSALFFLDAGAIEENRTKLFSSSLKLAPLIARLPGGRGLVRRRYIRGIRQNSGHQEWLDSATQRAYTEPVLDNLSQVVAMAGRLSRAREAESRLTLIQRVRVPVTVLLGAVSHSNQPDSVQLDVLAPLGALLRIVRLEGVGHFPHEEATATVAEYLLAPRSLDATSIVIPSERSESRNPWLESRGLSPSIGTPRIPRYARNDTAPLGMTSI